MCSVRGWQGVKQPRHRRFWRGPRWCRHRLITWRGTMSRIPRLLAVCAVAVALAACSSEEEFPAHGPEEFSVSTAFLAQSCTVQNIRGQPLKGTFCGGSSRAFNCTPGAVYNCNDKSLTNNCTLATACANG